MRGRPGCPTGQEKKSVGATVSNPLFYKERLGTKSPPHPPQCAHWGTFPPRGRLWTWECLFPSEKPSPPARPAGGRAVTNVGLWAAGQSRNIEKTSPWPPTRERWVQGGENLSPPWCSFLRLSFKESRAPRPGPGGERGAAPQGCFGAAHLKGTQPRTASGRWSGFGSAQIQTCHVGSRPGPGGEPRGRFQPAGVFTGPLAGIKPRLCRRPWRHPPCGGFFAGK